MPNKKSTKCVIYRRVSSSKQASNDSGLDSQERTCRDFARSKGYEVIKVFSDVISGKFADRPGMNELLSFLRKAPTREIVVVVDDISRFARDVSAHATLRDKIFASGAKIESPNQKFGEDAGGRFIETVMAAIAEHDRVKNAEQAERRSVARMRNGYWAISTCPVGYAFEKDAGGGKVLVPKHPLAEIVTEALEGFASGRFHSQTDVKLFLESKPEFPKGPDRQTIHYDKIKRLLTNVLYAGYLEFEKWGVKLTKANHEALISYATHEIILDRLDQQRAAPYRTNLDADFPLRGFIVCDLCGRSITGNWSRGRAGKRYPYYKFRCENCPDKTKSLPRDQLEAQFSELLKSLQPSGKGLTLARRLFTDAWELRLSKANEETRRLCDMPPRSVSTSTFKLQTKRKSCSGNHDKRSRIALEALKKLLAGEIKSRQKQNVVEARAFSDRLEAAVARYHANAITSLEMIQELIDMARDLSASAQRGDDLGLSNEELAFYDALAENKTAVDVLGNDELRIIARELVDQLQKNVTVDWHLKESARAKLRILVRRILKKFGYPPDLAPAAINTVISQAETLLRWSS